MFFNAWDWNVNTYDDADDTLSLIINETTTAIYEDLIKEKIKHRTKEEKFNLFVRRFLFISLNVFLICCGVAAIFCVNLFNSTLKNSISAPSAVTALLPAFIVSFVNAFIPTVTKKITICEKYDFANTLLKQQIWRNFATRLLNLGIFVLLNREMAFNESYFTGSPIISFDSANYSCREDQASNNFVRLLLTEFFLKFITAFAWMFLNLCKGGCGAKKGWRAEFPVSDEVVWLLYFQAVLWVALVWNPFVALIYPGMLYLMFKFIMFKLTKMQKKPLKSTNAQDMGNYIMTFLNISFTLIFIWIGMMISIAVSHGTYSSSTSCGPFKDNTSWQQPLKSMASSNTISKEIYYYIKWYPILWLILVIVITVYFLKRNTSTILHDYAKEKEKEFKLVISDLQRSIARIKHKIELNKMVEES